MKQYLICYTHAYGTGHAFATLDGLTAESICEAVSIIERQNGDGKIAITKILALDQPDTTEPT